MHPRLLIPALALPLLLTACGGDGGADDRPEPAVTSELDGDEAAIHDTLVSFTLEPRCDLATDDYLVERAFIADTPADACAELEDTFVEPVYEADDIAITDIRIDDDVATAVLGADPDFVETNISVTYELTLVDGTWKVSGDSFTSDDL